jgi:dihydrofolate synthase/folylpolyglutamate synthase
MENQLPYDKVLDDLLSRLPMFSRTGGAAYKPGLDNIIALCEHIGNPQLKLKCIHIAGTNGKGSVSHMLASILQESGYKTGLYTSPHLKDFRERIRINGEMIPKDEVVKWYHQLIEKSTAIGASFFELTVAMMLGYFAEQEVDIAVIETGMGGRLDSTNIIQPILSIITNIGLDHQQFLGNTIEAIAGEKAGIIKQNTPVLIGKYQRDTENVFSSFAARRNAPLLYANDFVEDVEWLNEYACRVILTDKVQIDIKCALTADYQLENMATVVAAITWLNGFYFTDKAISTSSIRSGIQNIISNTGFKGRWQILKSIPKVVADVAHNADGIKELLKQLKREDYRQLRIVFGAVKDKDITKILQLMPKDAEYYFCEPPLSRKLPAEAFQHLAREVGIGQFSIIPDPKTAFNTALYHTNDDDLLLVTGSFFVVAEII